MEIVSVRESPGYMERAIDHFTSRWRVDGRIYRDCITHSIDAENPLPQWYLLLDGDEIAGCGGLVTNDFISRMDLYPWLCALYIEEKYRGNFYSRLLIDRAKSDAAEAGFTKIYLSTELSGFYEKLGFIHIGHGYHPWGAQSRIYRADV